MAALDCSLLADGAADIALIPILKWVVRQHAPDVEINVELADLRHLARPPRTLVERILHAIDLYPCHILFIHRDAESQPPALRYTEISDAIETRRAEVVQSHVCVVPIRMQEAWLLLDESAIRRASGNPSGRMTLEMPRPSTIETI